jgi:hypothetical protein
MFSACTQAYKFPVMPLRQLGIISKLPQEDRISSFFKKVWKEAVPLRSGYSYLQTALGTLKMSDKIKVGVKKS